MFLDYLLTSCLPIRKRSPWRPSLVERARRRARLAWLLRLLIIALALALLAALTFQSGVLQAAAIGHIIPQGCAPTGNTPCTFDVPAPGVGEITVGPTSKGSGQVAIEAVQSPVEVYIERVDIMREATPGASQAWIAIRHHDSKDKYVLRLKNRLELQFIVEHAGKNTMLADVPYQVALNQELQVELDANGFSFTAYDLRDGQRTLLFSVTDSVGMIPAGNGDSLDLYTDAGTQACWDEVSGAPAPTP